jgi:hypothetical protein
MTEPGNPPPNKNGGFPGSLENAKTRASHIPTAPATATLCRNPIPKSNPERSFPQPPFSPPLGSSFDWKRLPVSWDASLGIELGGP